MSWKKKNWRSHFDRAPTLLLPFFSSLTFASVCCGVSVSVSMVLRDSSRISCFGSVKSSFFLINDCCHSLNCSFRFNSLSINCLKFCELYQIYLFRWDWVKFITIMHFRTFTWRSSSLGCDTEGNVNARKLALWSAIIRISVGRLSLCWLMTVIKVVPALCDIQASSLRVSKSHSSMIPSYRAIKNNDIRVGLHWAHVIFVSRRRQRIGTDWLLSLQMANIFCPIDNIILLRKGLRSIIKTGPLWITSNDSICQREYEYDVTIEQQSIQCIQ